MGHRKRNGQVKQWERNNPNEVTFQLRPLYQDINEENNHEAFFQWRNDEEQAAFFDSYRRETFVTFSPEFDYDNQMYQWTNVNSIDVSELPSLHRILVMRDITTKLRELDEQREDDSKILTENPITMVRFKLDDTRFSLRMLPTRNQPGNARLTMHGSDGGYYEDTHGSVKQFNCFDMLGARDIDSIVMRARRTGNQINDYDIIDLNGPDYMKKTVADELTFFMLLYDFEVARRLQRPFVNNSRYLDSLRIGLGIAMIHRINSQRENKRWMFFSGLFRGKSRSRRSIFAEINGELVNCSHPKDFSSRLDYTDVLLHEQFSAA